MHNPFTIEGKNILVLGASSGIGQATATICAQMGANVIVVGRNQERLQETLNELEIPSQHLAYALDLTDESSWTEMLSSMPIVDGVACCAGMANMNPFTFVSREEIEKVFNTNCIGPVLLIQKLIKSKKIAKGASVVFVASVDGPKVVHAGNSVYSASKNALVGMARNMAIDLLGKKIRVNCVLPGTTDTPMIRTANVTEEQLAETSKQFPMKRFARSEEIAHAIIYLLSDASSYVTGTELVVDGGYSII